MTTEDHPKKEFTAIVAAAGKSRRYGSPKLLEVIPGTNLSVIELLISQLFKGGVSRVITVLGPEGQPPYAEIGHLAEKAGSIVSYVEPHPPEMIDSIKAGIRFYQEQFQHPSHAAEHLLITPADLPGISAEYVRRLLSECGLRKELLIRGLTGAGRGVHPVAISRKLIQIILENQLPHGLKALWSDSLIERHEFLWDEPNVAHDLDFPHDWKNFNENG